MKFNAVGRSILTSSQCVFSFSPFSLYLSFTLPLGMKGWCGHIPPGALQVGVKTLVSTNEGSGDTGLHMGPRGKVSWQVPGHAVWSHSRYQVTQFGHTAGHGSQLPPGSLDRGAHGIPAHLGGGPHPPPPLLQEGFIRIPRMGAKGSRGQVRKL